MSRHCINVFVTSLLKLPQIRKPHFPVSSYNEVFRFHSHPLPPKTEKAAGMEADRGRRSLLRRASHAGRYRVAWDCVSLHVSHMALMAPHGAGGIKVLNGID